MMRGMLGYIAAGSNVGDRRRHLEAALSGLAGNDLAPIVVSSVWETEPVDSSATRWFWNMTVKIRTQRDPLDVLDRLLAIEAEAGRVRRERNGPRTLDLDLLMLGDLIVSEERLRLPHPRMWERRFVLEPLAEIEPGLLNPRTGRSVAEERDLLRDRASVRRLGPLASCRELPL